MHTLVDLSAEKIVVTRYSKNGDIDNLLPISVDLENKKVLFQTDHFSRFQLIESIWPFESETEKVIKNIKEITEKNYNNNQWEYILNVKLFDIFNVNEYQGKIKKRKIKFDTIKKSRNATVYDLYKYTALIKDIKKVMDTEKDNKKYVKALKLLENYDEGSLKNVIAWKYTVYASKYIPEIVKYGILFESISNNALFMLFERLNATFAFGVISQIISEINKFFETLDKVNNAALNNQIKYYFETYDPDNHVSENKLFSALEQSYQNRDNEKEAYYIDNDLTTGIRIFKGWFYLGYLNPPYIYEQPDNFWKLVASLKAMYNKGKEYDIQEQLLTDVVEKIVNSNPVNLDVSILNRKNIYEKGERINVKISFSGQDEFSSNYFPIRIVKYKLTKKDNFVSSKFKNITDSELEFEFILPNREGEFTYSLLCIYQHKDFDKKYLEKTKDFTVRVAKKNLVNVKKIEIIESRPTEQGNIILSFMPTFSVNGSISKQFLFEYIYSIHSNTSLLKTERISTQKFNVELNKDDIKTFIYLKVFVTPQKNDKIKTDNDNVTKTIFSNELLTYINNSNSDNSLAFKIISINDDNNIENKSLYLLKLKDTVKFEIQGDDFDHSIAIDIDGNGALSHPTDKFQRIYTYTYDKEPKKHLLKPMVRIETIDGEKKDLFSSKLYLRTNKEKTVSVIDNEEKLKKVKSSINDKNIWFNDFELLGKNYEISFTIRNESLVDLENLVFVPLKGGIATEEQNIGNIAINDSKTVKYNLNIPSELIYSPITQYFKIIDSDNDIVNILGKGNNNLISYRFDYKSEPIKINKIIEDRIANVGETITINLSEYINNIKQFNIETTNGHVIGTQFSFKEDKQGKYQVTIEISSKDDKKYLNFNVNVKEEDVCVFFEDLDLLTDEQLKVVNKFACDGIIDGNRGRLLPNNFILRYEFLKFALKRFGYGLVTSGTPFDDLDQSNFAYKYFATALNEDFFTGTTTKWDKFITAGEASLFIQRILNDKRNTSYSTTSVEQEILNTLFATNENSNINRINSIMAIENFYNLPIQDNDLEVKFDIPKRINKNAKLNLSIVVNNCKMPYEIRINWGDGGSTLDTENIVYNRIFSHVYQDLGSYKIEIKVEDASNDKIQYTQIINVVEEQIHPMHEQKIVPSDSTCYTTWCTVQSFGKSVAISDNYAVVGALDGWETAEGSVYIFRKENGNWIEDSKITSSSKEYFGHSLSISGDYIIIGAHYKNIYASYLAGTAYIYKRVMGKWIKQDSLLPKNSWRQQYFGESVSISDNYAIVGASNHAYIFIRNGDKWIQQTELFPSDDFSNSFSQPFGCSVSISGNYAIVGARFKSAYIFVRNGDTWTEQQKLMHPDQYENAYFGSNVSICNNYAIVGANGTCIGTNEYPAYIYNFNGNEWKLQCKLLPSNYDFNNSLVSSVLITEDYAIIGDRSLNTDCINYNSQGFSYIFKRNGDSWFEHAKIIASDGSIGNDFGTSVSFYNDYAIIGSPGSGSAYIYNLNSKKHMIMPFLSNLVVTNSISNKNDKNFVKVTQGFENIIKINTTPQFGNKIKNIEGQLLSLSNNEYIIVIYTYLNGWRLKCGTEYKYITIAPDGKWYCDITTNKDDHKSSKIIGFLFSKTQKPLLINYYENLPYYLFEKSIAIFEISRNP